MYCCGKAGKKVSSVEGNEEYMEFFLLSSRLQHRVLVHFFQVLLTWLNPLKLNTFFCSLQWVETVTAQMIPSSSPLVKFWHGSLFVTSTDAPFGLFHFRWKVEMRKWLVNNTSVYFFSSPGLLEHDFMKKTAREKRWSARVSRLKCTRSPRPVDRGRPQCPVSYPDNNSASRLFSPATREARVQFPANAFDFFVIFIDIFGTSQNRSPCFVGENHLISYPWAASHRWLQYFQNISPLTRTSISTVDINFADKSLSGTLFVSCSGFDMMEKRCRKLDVPTIILQKELKIKLLVSIWNSKLTRTKSA